MGMTKDVALVVGGGGEGMAWLRAAIAVRDGLVVISKPEAPPLPFVTDEKPQAPVVREGPKIGRNEPCHCGSGKKYKRCHGQ